MRTIFHALSCICLAVLVSGCMLNRHTVSGNGNGVTWKVEPKFFCPNDPVTVSWDFTRMPKNPANCRPRNGGYDSIQHCSSSRDCPDGADAAVCLDNCCCRREVYDRNSLMCDSGSGCYPPFEVTITADSLTIDPPVQNEARQVRGSRTVTPADTTAFRILGSIARPVMLFEETQTATMVRPRPETNERLEFPFACRGSVPGWRQIDLNATPLATEHVRIVGVRNASRHVIQLTGGEPGRGPITINPGEVTDAFSGPVRGIWSIGLSPTDPAALSRPSCEATNVANPWPDLQVELILDCDTKD